MFTIRTTIRLAKKKKSSFPDTNSIYISFQVQTQLHVWKMDTCHFIVWTPKCLEVIELKIDLAYEQVVLQKVRDYFLRMFIPFFLADGEWQEYTNADAHKLRIVTDRPVYEPPPSAGRELVKPKKKERTFGKGNSTMFPEILMLSKTNSRPRTSQSENTKVTDKTNRAARRKRERGIPAQSNTAVSVGTHASSKHSETPRVGRSESVGVPRNIPLKDITPNPNTARCPTADTTVSSSSRPTNVSSSPSSASPPWKKTRNVTYEGKVSRKLRC